MRRARERGSPLSITAQPLCSSRHVTSYSSATKLARVDVFMSSISFSSVMETSHLGRVHLHVTQTRVVAGRRVVMAGLWRHGLRREEQPRVLHRFGLGLEGVGIEGGAPLVDIVPVEGDVGCGVWGVTQARRWVTSYRIEKKM